MMEVDFKFINDFDYYMANFYRSKQGKTVSRNYIKKLHSRLRSIPIQAEKEELITKNPYARYQLKNKPTTRDRLLEEEIKILAEHDLGGNLSLIKIRDFFLFSVYTGLRFTDAFNLKMNDIFEENGASFLKIMMHKSEDKINTLRISRNSHGKHPGT